MVIEKIMASVRFICGTQTIHKELEARITRYLGTEDTILYPSCFDANGGLFETLLAVLEGFGAYPAVIQRELDTYLPFLATTKVLMAAVRAGVGREQAHEAVKEHAVAVALARREGAEGNDLVARLAADARLAGLDQATLAAALGEPLAFVGNAPAQVAAFVRQVEGVAADHPGAGEYRPEPIL